MGIKGQIPWNKGLKGVQVAWNKGLPHLKNENNPAWKGNNIGYCGLHSWLYRNYKKDGVCGICNKNSKYTECALIKGKLYKRNIHNFMELCKKCHNNYDGIGYGKGEKHFNSKLNDSKVIKIRKLFKIGKLTNVQISNKFNITDSNVSMIVKGKSWKHLL